MEARGVAAIPRYRFSRLRLQRLGTAMDGWVKCQAFVMALLIAVFAASIRALAQPSPALHSGPGRAGASELFAILRNLPRGAVAKRRRAPAHRRVLQRSLELQASGRLLRLRSSDHAVG